VPARLSAVERIRAQIDELFASEQDLGQVLEQVARLSVRLVIQAAVEAEVTEFLGRDRYVRGDRDRAGYRNGHAELTVKTTAGPVVLERPKLRGTTEPFISRLLGKGVSGTNALEALVLSGFVRGLSVRDVEAALAEALGPEAALSKSTVSRICEAIKTEFDAWTARDLSGIELEYLFCDGSHFRMHPGARAEPVLCAWGITTQGSPVLVGLAPGASEGHDPWASFLGELTDRGLRAPLLVITDGAAGLIGAVELVFANSLRQRCLVHRARKESTCRRAGVRGGGPHTTPASPQDGKRHIVFFRLHRCRNLLAKVPTHAQAEVKAAFWQIFDDLDAEPGEAAVAQARQRVHAFADRYDRCYPAAVACLLDTLPELTTFLRFPREHWARIRHTNLIERTFGETRRRTKVIGRLPGERSCLSLVWAVLDRAGRGWRGVVMTPAGVRRLQDLRRQLLHPPALQQEVVDQPVTPAA
jgi:putative transposase